MIIDNQEFVMFPKPVQMTLQEAWYVYGKGTLVLRNVDVFQLEAKTDRQIYIKWCRHAFQSRGSIHTYTLSKIEKHQFDILGFIPVI